MTRALVLGGGGPLGFAWECGLIAGFAQAGVDLGEADYVLGTSAGALAGARLAGGVPSARLAEAMMDPPPSQIALDASPETLARFAAMLAEAVGGTRNPAEVRRELGAFALGARTAPEHVFVEAIRREAHLAAAPWPARYACTAVDVALQPPFAVELSFAVTDQIDHGRGPWRGLTVGARAGAWTAGAARSILGAHGRCS